MKNNRIVRAYDSINPSPAEKAKMLDAILAEAKLEEPVRKQRKKKEPIIYTAKAPQPRRSSNFGTIAASIVLLLISGLVLLHMAGRPSDIAMEHPTNSVPAEKTAADHYAPVLWKYRRALSEGWTKEQCEIEGISLRMQSGADFTKAGYAFLDLDGDGREELIIAEESTDRTDNIWDFYTTLEDGTPIQLWVDEMTGGQCRLHEGNVISISDSYKDELEQTFYDLQDGKLVMREMLQWEDEDTVFHTDAEGNTRQVTSREGQSISYAYENQKLNLTWLADMPDGLLDTEAVERYTPVLEKYRTALAEGWPAEMCVENDLSAHTPVANEYDGLYYALSDLDGNGTKELVISEQPYREGFDTGFMDLYTIEDGTATRILSDAELLSPSLCEGGIVKSIDPQDLKCNKYVGFRKLTDSMLNLEIAVYEIDGQWFNEGYRRVGAAITREEADEIAASFKPLRLDFIAIAVPQKEDTLTGYRVFDQIIGKYATAIHEGWTEHQCEQKDISPQILSDTCIQHNLGWCLKDIDNNGVEELIVSDGVHLFDLYVMMPHDGSPGHLVMANGGESWQLCENSVLQKHGLYSGATAWRFYTLSDIDLVQRDMVFYEGETNQYSYGKDDKDLAPISKEQVGNILQENRTMELELTRFVDPEPFAPEETQYYEPLLDIYRQAVREKWNPGQCMENGISLMVGYHGELYGELGYSMMDLDGNGIQELIITDGTNIYDLYTLIQDEEVAPLQLASAMERIQYYLTADGLIYNMGSGGAAVSYHTMYSLDGRELKLVKGYMMDADTDPDHPWFYYDGEKQLGKCPTAEAAAAMDAIVFEEIPFTPFK